MGMGQPAWSALLLPCRRVAHRRHSQTGVHFRYRRFVAHSRAGSRTVAAESCNEVRTSAQRFRARWFCLDQILAHFPSLSLSDAFWTGDEWRNSRSNSKWNDGMRSGSLSGDGDSRRSAADRVLCFLTETLGADEHDVALISESSTDISGDCGAGLAIAGSTAGLRSFPAHKTGTRATTANAHRPRLTLPVPLHIARLHTVDVRLRRRHRAALEPLLPDLVPSPVSRLCQRCSMTVRVPTSSRRCRRARCLLPNARWPTS